MPGKKLDMGKCCVRFKKLEDVSLEVVDQAIARMPVKDYIVRVEKAVGPTARRREKPKGKVSRKSN